MTILDDLLSSLPDDDVPVRNVLVGAHWTVVCSGLPGRGPSTADWLQPSPEIGRTATNKFETWAACISKARVNWPSTPAPIICWRPALAWRPSTRCWMWMSVMPSRSTPPRYWPSAGAARMWRWWGISPSSPNCANTWDSCGSSSSAPPKASIPPRPPPICSPRRTSSPSPARR